MISLSTLPNGLRVVTKRLENTQAATVLILVRAGSRFETKQINGISHFLEHMFFKGAKKYKTAREVSETIDNIGGDFNAFTGKEYVGYYVKAAASHLDTSLDVLSDMLIHATFDSAEIDKERGVIMEEYNMYQDTPTYQIGWDFEQLVFGDQPMGWDQVGTRDVIMGLPRDEFVAFKQSLYVPKNIVISVAGNIQHEDIIEKVKRYFAELQAAEPTRDQAVLLPLNTAKRVFLRERKTEQSHICIGFPQVSEPEKDFWATKVLSVALGSGMSSRMFMNVREDKGLAYYINSTAEGFTDCGLFTTNAGVDLKRIDLAIGAVIEEYTKIAEENLSEKELTKTKEFIKGKTILKLEDSEEYAHLLGKYQVLYGYTKEPEEIQAAIDAVTIADVRRVAQATFDPAKMYLAVIGPYDDAGRFEKLIVAV
jgi:predicted Zn-dependent peptidase